MTASNFGFETLPTDWRACIQDAAIYGAQKNIDLLVNKNDSSSRFVQVTNHYSTSGVANLWYHVFKSRIDALFSKKCVAIDSVSPTVFPGRSPLLSHQIGEENFAYDRFQILVRNNLLRKTELLFADAQNKHDSPSWKWMLLASDDMHEGMQSSSIETQPPFIFVKPNQFSREIVVALFNSIHSAWSPSTNHNYHEEALSLAIAVSRESEGTASLWFELEEFASYCTLRESLNIVASGFYNERWIDVASERVESLRGTERCEPKRLMQEIANLANGRTAPLIVNEFNCISDGNHRLVAAWIWNMLNATSQCVWQTGDYHFECWLRNYLAPYRSETTQFTVWSALENLSFLLNDEESKKALCALRPNITRHRIPTLPVVPMLAYCNFAMDGSAFDQEGALVRFAPNLYEQLRQNAGTHFGARACYHLADRVPLPWFSVLVPSPATREELSLFNRQPKRA
jgi:hypothetical protein